MYFITYLGNFKIQTYLIYAIIRDPNYIELYKVTLPVNFMYDRDDIHIDRSIDEIMMTGRNQHPNYDELIFN